MSEIGVGRLRRGRKTGSRHKNASPSQGFGGIAIRDIKGGGNDVITLLLGTRYFEY
jgi:hypothetical protein